MSLTSYSYIFVNLKYYSFVDIIIIAYISCIYNYFWHDKPIVNRINLSKVVINRHY